MVHSFVWGTALYIFEVKQKLQTETTALQSWMKAPSSQASSNIESPTSHS